MKSKRLIIAGGGTGGHLYPGVAIARAVQKLDPSIEVHFVGAHGGLEEQIIPREKFPLHLVSVGKLHKSVGRLTQMKTLLSMPLALMQSFIILLKLRPRAVLGVGGFASGPMLLVSSLCGFRTYVWEPNAMPGMANRWLARFVTECLLVFDEAKKYLHGRKMSTVGIPVRFNLLAQEPGSGRLHVLVFGGSQGARAINQCVFNAIKKGGAWLDLVELVHQTGPHDFAEAQEVYKSAPANFQCFEYLHDMKNRYQWSDLVVCRAGASTVAEIVACQKAAIFIPLPTAADNHQQKNAEVLVGKNAARMILQKDLSPEVFIKVLSGYIEDRNRIRELVKNVQTFKFADADQLIAQKLLGVAVEMRTGDAT